MHDYDEKLSAALDELKRGEGDLEKAQALEAQAREEIRLAEREIEETRRREFVFFIGKDRFITKHEELTGAEIKAFVPAWPAGASLELEGEGAAPNRLIGDHEKVRFDCDEPAHFIQVPPATFGSRR